MAIISFKEFKGELERKQKMYNDCKHIFEDKPYGFSTVGRFGGHTINLYRCKKCGYECYNEEEYKESISHYDDRGMPID